MSKTMTIHRTTIVIEWDYFVKIADKYGLVSICETRTRALLTGGVLHRQCRRKRQQKP